MSETLIVELGGGRRRRYLRWTRNERLQHWTLAGCFTLLAVTGFGLAYPRAWWVRPCAGVPALFDLRQTLHHLSGALFIALGVYHAVYMLGTARGRALAAAFRPTREDLRHLGQAIRFFRGRRRDPPLFDHFSYVEKAEYLALLWGAAIMVVTGLMLWFENVSLRLFPKWALDLAATVHLYEAWLACLSIAVWHLYAVIFDPEVYPLDRSMLTGTIDEERLRHTHPAEWRRHVRSRQRRRLRRAPRAPAAAAIPAPPPGDSVRRRSDRRPLRP